MRAPWAACGAMSIVFTGVETKLTTEREKRMQKKLGHFLGLGSGLEENFSTLYLERAESCLVPT